MPTVPFAFQWSIPEDELIAIKDSKNGRLVSADVSNIPGLKYYLSIFPNGRNDTNRGQIWNGLGLKLGDVKKVKADYTYMIESANYSRIVKPTFNKSICRGDVLCKTEDFFNPEKNFFVDGKCTIKIYGTFKFETGAPICKQKWDGGELGNGLWEEKDDKNFTIAVDGKEIKVHKLILLTRSDVFKAMFNSTMKESIENKVQITDFTFEVVEIAVKMIYNCDFTYSFSLDEMMSLLQFFDKYQISSLKEKVELILINQISGATVCRLANCSIFTNSIQLKNKCMEFLEKSFASKTPLNDIEILDKDIAVKIHH